MAWSLGMTSRSVSSAAAAMARAIAAAVLRGAGSTMRRRSCPPDCSRTMATCWVPQTMSGAENSGPEARASVLANRLSSPTISRNCFARVPRDAGQRRVPAPPHRMTGWIMREARGRSGYVGSGKAEACHRVRVRPADRRSPRGLGPAAVRMQTRRRLQFPYRTSLSIAPRRTSAGARDIGVFHARDGLEPLLAQPGQTARVAASARIGGKMGPGLTQVMSILPPVRARQRAERRDMRPGRVNLGYDEPPATKSRTSGFR